MPTCREKWEERVTGNELNKRHLFCLLFLQLSGGIEPLVSNLVLYPMPIANSARPRFI